MTADRPVRIVNADPTPHVDAHLGMITQPGHGWAEGVMILTRRDVALYGVHLVQVKVEDRLNAQSEVLYFTEDGFKISPTIGSYGDGVRWSVGSFAQPASSTLRRVTRPFGVHHTSNLSQAAEFIRKIQRREANPSASATVKAQSPDAEAGSKSTDIQSSQGREGAYHE